MTPFPTPAPCAYPGPLGCSPTPVPTLAPCPYPGPFGCSTPVPTSAATLAPTSVQVTSFTAGASTGMEMLVIALIIVVLALVLVRIWQQGRRKAEAEV